MPRISSFLLATLACTTCLTTGVRAKNIVVRNLTDAGPGSLRAAVSSANETPGPDVIRFQKRLRGTIKLTSGQIEITDQLRIAGPGASRLTVSGNKSSRIFQIGKTVTASIKDLTISDGRNTSQENVPILVTRGGAILNDGGILSLFRVTMCNNVTIDEDGSDVVGGGAIVNSGFAVLAATNCQFIDNVASGGSRYAFGGAIGSVTESLAIVENCFFTGNKATSGGTSYGGAIGNLGGSELTVIDCTFFDNAACGTASGESAFGGAIATRPGTVDGSGSLTAIECSLLVANLAIGADDEDGHFGADAGGGAIYNFDSMLNLESSILRHNKVAGGNGDLGGGNAYGGAIHASGTGGNLPQVALIRRCRFRRNVALGGSSADASGGSALGGGIHNATSCRMDLRRSKLTGNCALASQNGAGVGGGLYTVGTVTSDKRTLRNIVRNKATTSDDNVFGNVTVD